MKSQGLKRPYRSLNPSMPRMSKHWKACQRTAPILTVSWDSLWAQLTIGNFTSWHKTSMGTWGSLFLLAKGLPFYKIQVIANCIRMHSSCIWSLETQDREPPSCPTNRQAWLCYNIKLFFDLFWFIHFRCYFLCLNILCLHMYICTTCMLSYSTKPKDGIRSPRAGVKSHHVVSGNQTQMPWKITKGSYHWALSLDPMWKYFDTK